jgi:hypothetical protein
MVIVPLLLIEAGTSAAAALSTAPEPEDEAVVDDGLLPDDPAAALLVLVELPGLLPLPQPAAVRTSAIPAAPTMTALEVLPARMCSPPGG